MIGGNSTSTPAAVNLRARRASETRCACMRYTAFCLPYAAICWRAAARWTWCACSHFLLQCTAGSVATGGWNAQEALLPTYLTLRRNDLEARMLGVCICMYLGASCSDLLLKKKVLASTYARYRKIEHLDRPMDLSALVARPRNLYALGNTEPCQNCPFAGLSLEP